MTEQPETFDVSDRPDHPEPATLPQRMRWAATIVDEAYERGRRSPRTTPYTWEAADLRAYADIFEAEDAAAVQAVQDQVKELAQEIADTYRSSGSRYSLTWAEGVARGLLKAGWRKGR